MYRRARPWARAASSDSPSNSRDFRLKPEATIVTADHDDRVVPSHSFKFAAALQAAQGCGRPVSERMKRYWAERRKAQARVK